MENEKRDIPNNDPGPDNNEPAPLSKLSPEVKQAVVRWIRAIANDEVKISIRGLTDMISTGEVRLRYRRKRNDEGKKHIFTKKEGAGGQEPKPPVDPKPPETQEPKPPVDPKPEKKETGPPGKKDDTDIVDDFFKILGL